MKSNADLPIEVEGTAQSPLGMPAHAFLRDYWQQRPLLIRRAIVDFRCPLNGDDLAALAMDEQALSRLVSYRRRGDRWSLRSGPFVEADFANLPQRDWTLLVQDVDKWDPDVAQILEYFRFLPRWRIDDIMVSFAAPGGSVGAHVDHYDVFLLQGLGHRRWAIDTRAQPDLSYRADAPLKLLRHFQASHEWLLEPGDMLYLPPGVPHSGVATDPCLTLSVGMRAPAIAELLGSLIEEHAQSLGEEQRYNDDGRQPAADPDSLEDIDVARLRTQLNRSLSDLQQLPDPQLADFFGRFLSQYRLARQPQAMARARSLNAIEKSLKGGARLRVEPWFKALRLAGDSPTIYLGGYHCILAAAAADELTADGIGLAAWSPLPLAQQHWLRERLAEGLLRLRR